jgi:oxygen-independent coproporphyrinogen-3 oxidase
LAALLARPGYIPARPVTELAADPGVIAPLTAGHAPHRVHADDGVELALFRAEPASRRPGALPLLFVHGTFSNRLFFLGARERGLARYMAERGFDAWVAELRGHGRSGPAGRRSAWQFEDWIRRDAPAFVAGVQRATGRSRLVWIGHSAGGIIGVAYAGLGAEHSEAIAGLVTVASPAPTGLHLRQRPMVWAALTATRLVGRFPARFLRIGPEDEHAGIMEQWMRWNLGRRWLGEDGTDYFASCTNIRAAHLALAGAGDWAFAPAALCADLLGASGSPDKTFLVCGRAQGFSENFRHNRLLISRSARAEVWPRIAAWIEARFG